MQRIKDAGIEERTLPGHTILHKPVEFRISLFTATRCSDEKIQVILTHFLFEQLKVLSSYKLSFLL